MGAHEVWLLFGRLPQIPDTGTMYEPLGAALPAELQTLDYVASSCHMNPPSVVREGRASWLVRYPGKKSLCLEASN
jgi:hypothetical protein